MAEKVEKIPEPNLRTKPEDFNGVEKFKLESNGVRGTLREEFRDHAKDDLEEAAEALAKSHGIYLEYNRAKTGREKDWMYMVRFTIPGGGAFTRDQYRVFDEAAEKYGKNPEGFASLRVTTRQNIQYHWIKKASVLPLIQEIAATGYYTLNGCGDNFRNVMACPLSKFSKVFNGNDWAKKVALYFRLDAAPYIEVFGIDPNYIRTPEDRFDYAPNLLNRKFKTAFSAVHQDENTGAWSADNCVELRSNEIGVAPILDPRTHEVNRFMVYIGGGQGEKNGKATFAALGEPFGVFTKENLLQGMAAITQVHSDWGDRQNRHWARMKYVVWKQGIPWYQERVREHGVEFDEPIVNFNPGPRELHHGWMEQPSNGLLAFGCYIENGRVIDGANGKLKTMVRTVMDKYAGIELMTTPNQDLLFTNLHPAAKEEFEADLRSFGWGHRNGKSYSLLRLRSGACVGLDTCRLSYTESERFEPELIDQLDDMGYGHMTESIGITGCERQCFRPATKTIGLVGQGPDLYELKLGGSEDASTQGHALVDGDKWYLRQIPREQVAHVIAALFDFYNANKREGESMGQYHHRVGMKAIVEHLKAHERIAPLMVKTKDAPYVPENQHF
jgi:sulfite reductase (NADPH) hemoprotein beta-component